VVQRSRRAAIVDVVAVQVREKREVVRRPPEFEQRRNANSTIRMLASTHTVMS